MKSQFGLIPSPDAVRDFDFEICCGSSVDNNIQLPEKFELPIDEWVRVYDQGNVNACVGYALAEAREAYHYKTTGESVSYSPGAIYGSSECRNGYFGQGMYLRTAIKGVTQIGFVKSSVFNIVKEMPDMKRLVDDRPDLKDFGQDSKLKGYTSLKYALKSKMVESMKKALYTYRVPLVVSSYDYFGGGHCFILYGWDDTISKTNKANVNFLLRNTWGKSYGKNGNHHIPVNEIDEVFMPIFDDFSLKFNDVSATDWYYNDILKATFSGLVQGVSKDKFEPNKDIIRGDVAITISRLLNKLQLSINGFLRTLEQKGVKTSPLVLKIPDGNLPFVDIQESDYYYKEIGEAVSNGLMNGVEDNKFEPNRPITRAEFAVVVVRTYEYIKELIQNSIPSVNLETEKYTTKLFTDVRIQEWYAKLVSRASMYGFMNGDGNGMFRPCEMITRAEATAVLNRLFKSVDMLLEKIR